jgi:hypothetical protein
MTIMRNGASGEIIENLTYAPGLQGGTDLEGATKTISNTVENAVADYTSVHTIAAPTDARIAVLRGCMRLTVTIDSFAGGCTTLNARVKRGGASVWTGVLEAAAGAGQKIISWDITTLITGAQTNTLFLWVNVGTCVISEVTMWTGVGSMQANPLAPSLSLTHTGLAQIRGTFLTRGTGTVTWTWVAEGGAWPSSGLMMALAGASTVYTYTSTFSVFNACHLIAGIAYLYASDLTVATDIGWIYQVGFALRSQP